MFKIYTFCIALCLFGSSCNNPKTQDAAVGENEAISTKAERGKLAAVLKKYEKPSQIFKVSASKPSVVTGRKGTKITN